MKPRPRINRPAGILSTAEVFSLKVAITSGAGCGVKVGSLVGMDGELKAARSVGSISTTVVEAGVGVGGAAIIGMGPIRTVFT
jgi:hypothetical protein